MTTAFVIHRDDNVATALDDLPPGPITLLGESKTKRVVLSDAIKSGHKLALEFLPPGEIVIKYGIPIGSTTQPIPAGSWVHLHNVASAYDERSSTLNPETGASTDVRYE